MKTPTKEQKKEFALSKIGYYFSNPLNCAYEEGYCKYLTNDGKMCVFGRELEKYKKEYEDEPAEGLLMNHGEKILKPESRGILAESEWQYMQAIHDSMAKQHNREMETYIRKLNLFTYEELQQYADKLKES